MWRSGRNNNIIALLGIYDLGFQAWCFGDMKAHCSFRDEEGFVVHLVPVRGRTRGLGRDYKLDS